jgi:hypothetical protein
VHAGLSNVCAAFVEGFVFYVALNRQLEAVDNWKLLTKLQAADSADHVRAMHTGADKAMQFLSCCRPSCCRGLLKVM